MRDRLIEFVKDSLKRHIGKSCNLAENITDDILANGVILPPCKVGETIYYIHETFYDNEYMKAKEDELDFSHIIKVVERPNRKTNLMLEKAQFDWCLMDNWLKGDIFLTKEEAETELRKRGKENA